MCKVMGMSGLNDKNRPQALKLMKIMSEKMTKQERDGYGYAAIDAQGNVYGEKWLSVSQALKKRPSWVRDSKNAQIELNQMIVSKFGDLVEEKFSYSGFSDDVVQDESYCKFGNGRLNNATAIIAHSRFATVSAKTINEVHPFYHHQDNLALIHNGVVNNHNASYFEKVYSECDSEVILHQYAEHLVPLDTRAITDAMRDIEGYFACLTLANAQARDGSFYPVMDIFKGDACLDVVYVHDLGINVFCTKGDIIISSCKELKMKCSRAYTVKDLNLIRIDAISGEIVERQPFSWSDKSVKYNGNMQDYWKSKYGADYAGSTDTDIVPHYKESRVYESHHRPYAEDDVNEANETVLEQLNYKVNKG